MCHITSDNTSWLRRCWHDSGLPVFAELLMKRLDVFNVTLGHFPAGCFNGTAGIRVTFNDMFGQLWWQKKIFWDLLIICLWKLGIFDETGHCFSSVCGKKVDICWYMLGQICSCEPYILNEVLWHFPAVFLATELNIFDEMSGLFAVEKQVFLMKRWGIF